MRKPGRLDGHWGIIAFTHSSSFSFTDYKKAFGFVETNAILSEPIVQGVETSCVRTLAVCYVVCQTTVQLLHCSYHSIGNEWERTIPRRRSCSPLQWIVKSRNEEFVHVNGKCLSSVPFVDDVVLFSNSTAEAEVMPTELTNGLRLYNHK